MASEMVPIADIKNPEKDKTTALSSTSNDQPIVLEPNKQIEIYSDMGRTRTGIQDSHERWGDRLFGAGDVAHPCAKPQDRGMNPAYTERQRRFMGAELGRRRAGMETDTGMVTEDLRDFARKGKKKRKKHNPY